MKPLESVLQMWESYRREVVPTGAGEVQVQECRRAFYAGVHAMYQQLLEIGEDHVTEDAGERQLEAVGDELLAFKQSVGTPLEHLDTPKSGAN